MGFAAGQQGGALVEGVLQMALHLGHCRGVDQRTGGHALLRTVADLQPRHRSGKLVDEGVVDAVLYVDAVGTDAGLPGVAVLGDHRALDRRIQIGVVEDDEGCVAAQLQ